MFKKCIRNIVIEEINDIKLENTLKQLKSEPYWRDKAEREIKNRQVLVNHKNQIIIGLEEENEDLKQENEKLKETIENLEGKLISKSNLLSEQKEENVKLKILYLKEKLEKNKLLFNGYGEKYEINFLKQENEKIKDILNEIHEICFSTWGVSLPYCEVRRLLNVIREISKIG